MEARKSKEESVISRLMGLDQVPPPESTQKMKRVLSENYLRRVSSIGAGKKRSCQERNSLKTGLKVKKEFDGNSQVVTIHRGDKHHETKSFDSSLGLTVNKPQTSLAFQRSPEYFDSRNDCFGENAPKRNSRVSKDVDNLQNKFSLSNSGERTSLNSPNSPLHRNVGNFRKSMRMTEFGYLKPPEKLGNGTATRSHGNQLCGSFRDIASSRLKPQNNAWSPIGTQSFVSKLLSGESKNSDRYICVPTSPSGVDKCREFSGPDHRLRVGFEVKDRKKFASDIEVAGPRCESETFATKSLSSSCSSDWKRRHNSFKFSDKSFANEANKLLERRQRAQSVKAGGLGSKANTLCELFVTQNHDSRRRNHGRHGLKDLELNRFSKQKIRYEAFRSKWSLHSDTSLNLARLKLRRYNSDDDNGSESRDMKLDSDTSNSLPSLDSEASNSYSDMKDNNSLEDIWTRKNKMQNKFVDCDIYKQNMVLTKPLISTISSTSIAADTVFNTESTEIAMKPSAKPEVEQLGLTSSIVSEKSDHFSSRATDISPQQNTALGFHEESSEFQNCYRMELDPMVYLEEACHPSPISVLEQPFGEETMQGSELLGRTMDDFCELRRHLELLESETSETSSEEPEMVVSSDDENEEGLEITENKAFMKIGRVEESRKFSYLIDVLAEASLNGRDLAEFSTWHSLDFPMSLSVFDTLEKKYGDQVSWKRSERRLLFDLVNTGLTKILLPFTGVNASEKSVSRRFSAIRDEEMLEDGLWKLLVCQEKESGKYTAEKMLESELGKSDLGDEIVEIGLEIERLLFGELLAEFF